MNLRHDAMAAAAEWIVGVERVAQHTEGLVATVGRVETLPGAGNVIAGEVLATVDVRHASDQVRLRAVDQISELATEAGRKRGVAVETKIRMQQPGVPMSERLQRLLERAAAGVGCEAPTLVSGAGHDAMVLAPRVPAAMLFVRSPGGLSHHPDENVLVEDVDAALQTVMEFLRLLGDDGAGKQTSDA
jgi:allantoate deiminase